MKIKLVLEDTEDTDLKEGQIKAVLVDGKRFVPEATTQVLGEAATVLEVRPIYTEHQSRVGVYFKLPTPIKFFPGQKVRIIQA